MPYSVVLSGYFGFGNLGDDAILQATVEELRRRRPDCEIVTVSGEPAATSQRYGVTAIDFFSLDQLADAVRRSSLVLFGMGGVFQDYWGAAASALFAQGTNGIEAYVRPAVLAHLYGVPSALFCSGVGPLRGREGRRMFALACGLAETLIVRDEASVTEARASGVDAPLFIGSDPGHLLTPAPSDQAWVQQRLRGLRLGGRPFVAFALRAWEFGISEAELARAAAACVASLPLEVEPLFVPFHRHPGHDAALAQRLLAAAGRGQILEVESPAQAIALFGRARAVVAMRAHAVIFSALAGTPAACLSYDPKLATAAIALGFSGYLLGLDEITRLPAALGEALAASREQREETERRVETMRASARNAFDLVAQLPYRLPARPTSASQRTHGVLDEIAGALRERTVANERLHEALAAERLERRLETERLEQALASERLDRAVAVERMQQTLAAERLQQTLSAERLERTLASERLQQSLAAERLQSSLAAERLERMLASERLQQSLSAERLQQSLAAERLQTTLRRQRSAVRQLREQAAQARRLRASHEQLQFIYRSRFWRAATVYWSAQRRLRSLAGSLRQRLLARGIPALGSPTARAAALPPAPDALAPARRPSAPAAVERLHDVVCFPIIDWGFRFQRPQQLMSCYARAGHRVFYLAQAFRSGGPTYQLAEVAPRVQEVSLRGSPLNVYTDVMDDADVELLFASLDALRRDLGLGATAAFVQLPFWWPLAERARRRFAWSVIYDCMDHHAGFSTNGRRMLALEDQLRSGADLVLATSASLEQQALTRSQRVLRLANAADYEHFAVPARAPGARPTIGYYGAIAEWFDSDLVADLATRRPEWDFVLVGSTFTADTARLGALPNVTLPGEQPYEQIPRWLERFDVAIIPFKRNPLTDATNPVKAYEILAAGKPLVSVPLPEVVALSPLVRVADSAAGFEREITAALAETGAGLVSQRRAFARQNTWEHRFAVLDPAVCATFPRVSIVIVTYNNLDINRLCLESLFARTEWPNLEVIVVDNASHDGTLDYLQDARNSFPGLDVIRNSENAGFAAANNHGLQRATGDFFVLLNNDTVVTRGWLAALIRHLQSDDRIGMVGPVTNAVGNEAMVQVGYRELNQLPAWAAGYVREHDGESFEIPMLAMFCLAMRRSLHQQIGPLDERFGRGLFEDDDYARRVRTAGYRLVCARDAFVHHWMKASFGKLPGAEYDALFERNRRLFEEKWGEPWSPHKAPPVA